MCYNQTKEGNLHRGLEEFNEVVEFMLAYANLVEFRILVYTDSRCIWLLTWFVDNGGQSCQVPTIKTAVESLRLSVLHYPGTMKTTVNLPFPILVSMR